MTVSINGDTGVSAVQSGATIPELNVDSGTLYVDATNNRVGVGTSSPDFKLEVVGGTNNGIHIKDAESATVYGGLFTQASVLALVARSNHALTFGTNDTERMRIDSGGRVTMPYQPIASINSNVTYDQRNGGATTEIVWTSERVNVGNHYSSSTGRFTAPVTGNYLITASFHGPSDSGQRGYIAKNGTQIRGWAGSSDSDWGNFGTQIIADLVAGDYISLYIWGGNYVHGDPAWGGWSINLLG